MKKLWLLLILLALLVGLYFLLRQNAPREKLKPLIGIDSLKIAAVEIKDSLGTLKLARDKDKWRIAEPVAWEVEPARMKLFFEQVLSRDYATTPVGEGSEAIKTYRLEKDKALRVKVFDANNKARVQIWFSNLGNPFDYFRFDGGDKVYQIRAKVASVYTSEFEKWRSPHVLSYSSEQLLTIEVKHPKNQYTLTRKGAVWHYRDSNEDFDIPSGNVTMGKILNSLAMLGSYTILSGDDRPPADSLGSLACEVELELTDTQRRKLEFFNQDERYLLRVDGDDSMYFVVLFDTVFRFTRHAPLFRAKVGVLPPS